MESNEMSNLENRLIDLPLMPAVFRYLRSRKAKRSRAAYVFLSTPCDARQRILAKHSGRILEFEMRSPGEYEQLRQIFETRVYDTSHLRRGPAIKQVYADIVARSAVPLIIDCGANIGLTAAYFADVYPKARIVSIEPEPGNFRHLRIHCEGLNVNCLQAAVASEAKRGRIVDPGLGNDAFRVEEVDGEDLEMVAINQLLADPEYRDSVPFIAKVDIEGFEQELFSKNTDWMQRFPLLIVEIHDWLICRQAVSGIFLRAISALDRDFIQVMENIFSIDNTMVA
jgi:FkbM family methyltransferase